MANGHVSHLINRLNEKNTYLVSFCIYFIRNMRNLLHCHKGPERDPSKITPCKTQSANCPRIQLITIWQPSLKRIACFDLLWTNIVELRMNAATSIWHRWWVWEKEEKRWLHWVWKMRTTECSMIFLREHPEIWNFHQG